MHSSTSAPASTSNKENKIVYFGVININEYGKNIGAVDIWRDVITKKIFCEEKRIGILDISENIGMPVIKDEEKWAVAVNRHRKGKDRWKLVRLINKGISEFVDTDDETKVSVNVEDYKINNNPEWWSFLVSENINKSIEISEDR
ncbi:MAG: hypothetical protein M3162_06420 [Thermoproteota archaeon]|nr:hypothetical protein [Thermoproteota archaeon]